MRSQKRKFFLGPFSGTDRFDHLVFTWVRVANCFYFLELNLFAQHTYCIYCLSICLMFSLSYSFCLICLSVCMYRRYIYRMYAHLSAHLYVCLPAFLHLCTVCLSVCIYVRLSFCIPVCIFAHLSVHLSTCIHVLLPYCHPSCLPLIIYVLLP
jgi:hypothetical protein